MAKYIVSASYVSYCEVEIEADSLEQAQEKAKDLDGGEFTQSGYGDWNIDEVWEVK